MSSVFICQISPTVVHPNAKKKVYGLGNPCHVFRHSDVNKVLFTVLQHVNAVVVRGLHTLEHESHGNLGLLMKSLKFICLSLKCFCIFSNLHGAEIQKVHTDSNIYKRSFM